jgi:nitrite reductase (NO-forming)
MIHSVDFHAVTGPGGGAAALQVDPGHEKSMTWKALVPGLYVYHCATPMVAEHIANGMYGLILVEPEEGLPRVDCEFYVMQGETYTDVPYGQHGSAEFSVEKLLNERPEYFVFNGSVGALAKLHPLKAKVGDVVRIFFGVGGPNFTSSFHVIGEIFDKVYSLGGVLSQPLEGVQTVTVAPGGAVITEFKTKVPGNYTLVDHALARAERGLVGILRVEGPPSRRFALGAGPASGRGANGSSLFCMSVTPSCHWAPWRWAPRSFGRRSSLRPQRCMPGQRVRWAR